MNRQLQTAADFSRRIHTGVFKFLHTTHVIRPCLVKEGYDSTINFPACCTDVECIFEIIFTIQISFLDALTWFSATNNLNLNLANKQIMFHLTEENTSADRHPKT